MSPISLLAPLLALALSGGTITVGALNFHYWPGSERLARHLAGLARGFTPLPGLPPDVLRGDAGVRVDLAPDRARWDSLTGGVPDWSAGVAVPGENRIILPAFGSRARPLELGEILRHELAHMALHRFLAPADVPRWFDEGYATWASGGIDWQSAWMLRLAFALHRAPDLAALQQSWPAEENQARLAYLISATAVSILADRAGERGLGIFFQQWKRWGSADLAMRRTFGITYGQFERDWQVEVRRRYGWAVLVSDTLVFWLLVLPMLMVLVLMRRRRDRDRLERLRAAEPPDLPAWWLETAEDSAPPPSDGKDSTGEPPAPSPPSA